MQDNRHSAFDPIIPIRGEAVGRLLHRLGICGEAWNRGLAEYDTSRMSLRVYGEQQTGLVQITRDGHYRAAWFDHASGTAQYLTAAIPGHRVLSYDQAFEHDHRPVGAERNLNISVAPQEACEIRDLVLDCLCTAVVHAANRKGARLAPLPA